MSDKDTSGPAFPCVVENGSDHEIEAFCGEMVSPKSTRVYMGMSLRDYFAAKVCGTLLTTTSADNDYPNIEYQREANGPTCADRIASISYKMADAMLKARDQ